MTISLIGFMGSGKSSVGRKLSALLCLPFLDLDGEIVSRSGISIADWFSQRGESAFRAFELQTLKQLLSECGDAVLAVGGGTPVTREASDILKEETTCVYLKATVSHLERILSVLDNSGRPLLRTHSVDELLSTREPLYERTAGYTVNLADFTEGVPDERDFEDIAAHVRNLLCQ